MYYVVLYIKHQVYKHIVIFAHFSVNSTNAFIVMLFDIVMYCKHCTRADINISDHMSESSEYWTAVVF